MLGRIESVHNCQLVSFLQTVSLVLGRCMGKKTAKEKGMGVILDTTGLAGWAPLSMPCCYSEETDV